MPEIKRGKKKRGRERGRKRDEERKRERGGKKGREGKKGKGGRERRERGRERLRKKKKIGKGEKEGRLKLRVSTTLPDRQNHERSSTQLAGLPMLTLGVQVQNQCLHITHHRQ